MNYRKINNLTGWMVFAFATMVYLLTMERTASFWDCGEFLACASKLEVGHSPGAPFFMTIQRLFAIFSGGSKTSMAAVINSESAIASGFTILFLFWSITHFARKLLIKNGDTISKQQLWLIMGSGVVGALAYTFSDTFWFSAVEAEVYATSSCFTALVFWAMLKWEDTADSKYADRWLVLIAYLIGISIGIHLLNLLAIPALAVIFYFRRYKATKMGIVIAFVVGCVMLAAVQFGVIQYLPMMAAQFDLLFVNSFGMPFDSGALFFAVLLLAGLVGLLFYAKKKNNYWLHIGTISLLFIILGFSSYLIPMIRSRANVGVDMTNPDNVMSLVSYLKREQFLQQPLLYGPDYNTPVTGINQKGNSYSQVKKDGKDYYEVTDHKFNYKYDESRMRFFPRIWDNSDPTHVQYYQSYLGLDKDDIPTSADNLSFFMGYQINWMWWRYFMWNYAGRQNDFEGQGEVKNGNWISGIQPLDKMRVGDMNAMSSGFNDNKARNQLYFLPLILGILGMIYQFNHHRKDAMVVLILFFFTGIAIAIYLNMAALQPRERDYAFAGSTYAFAIWIGLGVLLVQQWIQRLTKTPKAVYLTLLLCLLAVPALMAKEEWDDHDRSGKSLARATAYNTLMSCAPNAILFTSGDNDTFPLWYLQEVEGIRRDVRVLIIELLGTDWYVDQLNYRVNDADAVPMIWKKEDYIGGNHNYVGYFSNPQIPQDKYFNLEEICKFVISNDQQNKLATNSGSMENYLPSKKFFVQGLPVQQLVDRKWISPADSATINNEMKFEFQKDAAYKNDLAVLNIIAANARDGWKRPIYFNGSYPGNDNPMGLANNLRMEGVVYHLLPFTTKNIAPGEIMIDKDKTSDLFTKKYIWGGAEQNDVYFDEKNRVMLMSYRFNAARTADELTAVGRKEEAVKLLDKIMTSVTESSYYYDVTAFYIAQAYYRAGAQDKGKELAMKITRNAEADIAWTKTLSEKQQESTTRDLRNDLGLMNMLASTAAEAGDSATAKFIAARFQAHYTSLAPVVNASAP
ncbi:glycosyltransferase family 117 protein [Taibaiella soli]|uniref:DUF2723 domain-containing protein n=1 Tax=Taibaiella soli TaxID=1649169 RepID=A0A2W2BHA0_9BACT|nr:DUF2723 domain-containing protein [Taibaiella soli]PZF72876.1 DUF2723 domain-containing protein [Taibaiella soli]